MLVGGSSTLLDLLVISLLVEGVGMQDYLGRNAANLIGMEVGTIWAFFLNRKWTWSEAPRRKGVALLRQFSLYHLSILAGVFVRILVFASLGLIDAHYLLSACIAIALAAVVNFIFYEKVVFRAKAAFSPEDG